MSDSILHECGIALIRLRKSLPYYIKKYGLHYAVNKMYVLMQKQQNRGQDGAGIANIKINQEPGLRYISRYRSKTSQPVNDLFKKINEQYENIYKEPKERWDDEVWIKQNIPFTGALWLGHLRYGTHGLNNLENIHPFIRQNNWRSRNLVIAGNFNMTNGHELFDILIQLGQHPKERVDTVTVMEKIGHFLDEEVELLYRKYKNRYPPIEISGMIENNINFQRILKKACRDFDGGYTIAGLTGSGSTFVVRDPAGIRPAYYYEDDEVVVVASEKPAIKTAFNVDYAQIDEIRPGHALIITKSGEVAQHAVMKRTEKRSCSFERIYFSHGTDPEIYKERKKLGELLASTVLRSLRFNLEHTLFSYIPNTAETAFIGIINGIDNHLEKKKNEVIAKGKTITAVQKKIISMRPRVEKIIFKDAKLRTFITNDADRNNLMTYVYDTTYEVVKKQQDTLVIVDDSIVRGTTLEQSILKALDRLEPKKIIIVSSAPQIRFPDCYGIDMSRMDQFIAFRATIALIKEHNKEYILQEIYALCLQSKKEKRPKNYVKKLYDFFTYKEVSKKITAIIKPKNMKAELNIIFQTIEGLREAIPHHRGDWYFTGNYPTRGGIHVANQAFINYMDGEKERAY